MKEKLEQLVTFSPAFDKRSDEPSKNYGIGCVRCMMILKGSKGAIHFTFLTGMLLPETIDDYIKDGRAKYEKTSYGHYFLNKPMGGDVGYHSPTPHFEGQTIAQSECDWIGKPCYCDGSFLRGEEWFDIFIRKGSTEIWKMMEEEYHALFK